MILSGMAVLQIAATVGCGGGGVSASGEPCPASTFSTPGGGQACTAWAECIAGQYVAREGSAATDRDCSGCTSGTFSIEANAPLCVAWTTCAAGTYVSNTPSATTDRDCTTCEAGTTTSDVNQSSCQSVGECAAGTVQTDPGTPPACSACSAGSYCAGGVAPAVACAAGTWDHDADPATACTAMTTCVAGQYVLDAGNATTNRSCAACASGAFSTGNNAVSCAAWTTCTAGTYVSHTPSATTDRVCTPCPAGTWDDDSNPATACIDLLACPSGILTGSQIQTAVALSGDGAIIQLADNCTYNVTGADCTGNGCAGVNIVGKANLTIKGYGPGRTTVNFYGDNNVYQPLISGFAIGAGADNITIKDITIRGLLGYNHEQFVAVFNGDNGNLSLTGVTVTGLEIHDVASGIRIGSGSIPTSGIDAHTCTKWVSDVLIANNAIYHPRGSASGSGYGIELSCVINGDVIGNRIFRADRHAIYWGSGHDGRILGNLVIDNGKCASGLSWDWGVVIMARSQNLTAAHNTIMRSATIALTAERSGWRYQDGDVWYPQADQYRLINNHFVLPPTLPIGSYDIWVSMEPGQRTTLWHNTRVSRVGSSDTYKARVTYDRDFGVTKQSEVCADWPDGNCYVDTQALAGAFGDQHSCSDDHVYLVQSGVFHHMDPLYTQDPAYWGYAYRTENWAPVKALSGMGSNVYMVSEPTLYEFSPSLGYRSSPDNWAGTNAMTAGNGRIYLVQDGWLHEIDSSTWAYRYPPSSLNDWAGTTDMVALGGMLYVVKNDTLYEVNPADWSYNVLPSDTSDCGG